MTAIGFGSGAFGAFAFGEGSDDFPPFIGNWSPFAGAEISRLGTIEFDITDDTGIADTEVTALFDAGVAESVWTEEAGFAEPYRRGSGRVAITDGYRWILRRTGGWPAASARVDVVATDLAGNVTAGHASFP